MVSSFYHQNFKKKFSKIRDIKVKEKIINIFEKIKDNPESGKPMMYERLGTRELYVGSLRLAYSYSKKENSIIFLDLYHKDEQ